MELHTKGFTHIAYPDNARLAVNGAAAAWRNILLLPASTKDTFTADGTHVSVGYERKGNGERGSSDTKENFDITRQGIIDLRAHTDTSQVEPFLTAAEMLLDSLDPVAEKFCAQVETEYDIENFSRTTAMSAANRFVRFLYYPPMPEGSIIGEAHTDHSGYTFHLYESTDGCQGLSLEDGQMWFDMPTHAGEMTVFGGMQLQFVSEGKVKALCHEIRANDTANTLGRIAIVCFNVLGGVPAYDRATHGRLQEQTPGFNYKMNHEEFSKLFK